MGFGDQLMATGMAKGAKARGKRIAFGTNGQIMWDHMSEPIFRYNQNIAKPGDEKASDLEWIPFYRGNRIYNDYDRPNNRWKWNYSFKPTPGEITFDANEQALASRIVPGYILVDAHVPTWKPTYINKQWPVERYQKIVDRLREEGREVKQFKFRESRPLDKAEIVKANNFREAMAILSRASAYIGAEGGLHHAAAALGLPAVVIFGGYIPPQVTGYDFHENVARGVPCGSLSPCPHCRDILNSITVDEVWGAWKRMSTGSSEGSGVTTTSALTA